MDGLLCLSIFNVSQMSKNSAIIYYGGFIRFGGVFTHVKAIEKELLKKQWDVRVITLDSLPIWCRYIPHLVEKLVNTFNRPLGFFYKGSITKVLYKSYFNTKVDLRIFEDIYLSWNSKNPSITVLHAIWSDNLQAYSVRKRAINKLKIKEVEVISKINHSIVTVSYPYLKYLENEHFSLDLSKKIDVVELGVDQSIYITNCVRNFKSIVYSGSFESRKNVTFLLEVFKNLYLIDPSYKLTLIGAGPDKQKLIDFTKSNRLPVKFLGKLSHEDVISELPSHGIYLHTSIKESFSYSLLEAKLLWLKTCAYAKLEVPSEFIDVAINSFNVDEWCNGIMNIDWTPTVFNAEKFTVEKMISSLLRLAN